MDTLSYKIDYITEKLKLFSAKNSLIISNNTSLKKLTDFEVFSIEEFAEFLIKKSASVVLPHIIAQADSIFIIHSIIKDLFQKNIALLNLTKSAAFSAELYKLFSRFFEINATPDKLLTLLKSVELESEDLARIEIIIEAFDKYISILKYKNYIDKNFVINYATDILINSNATLQLIQKKYSNIVIDSSVVLKLHHRKLLDLLNIKTHIVDFLGDTNNKAAKLLAQKYLNIDLSNDGKEVATTILEFSDNTDEAKYVCDRIAEKVKNENYSFSDFAICLNNKSSYKIFSEFLALANIPSNIKCTDNSYLEFIAKLIQYFNICENFSRLQERSYMSQTAQEEICEEINLYFENIMTDVFENQFIKDKFLYILENSNETLLSNTVKNNLSILTVTDMEKMENEFSKIKELQNFYNNNDLVSFIIRVSKDFKNKTVEFNINLGKLIKKIHVAENLNKIFGHKKLEFNTIIEIINRPVSESAQGTDCVTITSLENISKQLYKEIFFPDLTEKSIPQINNSINFISEDANIQLTRIIKNISQEFKGIIFDAEENIAETAQHLVTAFKSASQSTILSTHKYECKKQIAPSIYYQYLKSFFKEEKVIEETTNKLNSMASQQLGFDFIINSDEVVVSESDILMLSPSAISSFQSCPRKYYFAHLLGLKGKSTFAATYGTITHAIIELFNQKYSNLYEEKTILNLADILFNSNTDSQMALSKGFLPRHIDLISATDVLSLSEMKQNFISAIKEMSINGFFNKIPDEIISEKSFEFELEEIPNVIFNGRVDAIYRYGHEYVIVDFKTGQNKPELSYLISDNGVNFRTSTGQPTNVETKQNEFEYQIPIYFLASQYAEEFKNLKDNLNSIGLLYIRPKNKNGGFKKDLISAEILKEFSPKLIQNLKETLIDKIRNCSYYSPCNNHRICENCDFYSICDTNSEDAAND